MTESTAHLSDPDRPPARLAILGASGYTGSELIRLLLRHPQVRMTALTGETAAGRPLAEVFPQFRPHGLPDLIRIEDVAWDAIDAVFCALPHGTTQAVIASLPHHLPVIDLSADFRLHDLPTYQEWYGHPHQAPDLQPTAVYGLTELNRRAIAAARLIANPGCYPTCALLPLIPLVAEGLVDPGDLIIDAKSGISGAGRALRQSSLFSEAAEGVSPYSVGGHRHAPEMEQELSIAAGRPVRVSFTPQLVPMVRGELCCSYVRLQPSHTADDLRACLAERYRGEPFIQVLPAGALPATKDVRGSNLCAIAVVPDRIPGRAIVLSVIDNLVKGASGQAVQNLNVLLGVPETTALEQAPLSP